MNDAMKQPQSPATLSLTEKLWMVAAGAVVVLIALALPELVHAGVGGTELDEVYDTLTDWTQGTLGRIITLLMVIIGVAAGIVRQSLMVFAVGLGAGIGLYNAPVIVESIVGATLAM